MVEAGDLWLAQGETDGLEASTLMQYRQHLEYHIKPLIGAVKLAELSPAMMQTFRNRSHPRRSVAGMAKKVVASLGAMLANAMAAGKVARNVVREQARETRRQNGSTSAMRSGFRSASTYPTKDDIRAMLTHAEGRWGAADRDGDLHGPTCERTARAYAGGC